MDLNEFQQAVSGKHHTYSKAPCAVCGDLDGCHAKIARSTGASESASSTKKQEGFPRDRPMSIELRWNVPPHNTVHVVLSETSAGIFYVSIEDLDRSRDPNVWQHRPGSAVGCGIREHDALATAERLWEEEKARSGGRSKLLGP
jgi:hypothetical protein